MNQISNLKNKTKIEHLNEHLNEPLKESLRWFAVIYSR